MPRRNRVRRAPQHGKDRKRGRGWHRKATSPGIREASRWLLGKQAA